METVESVDNEEFQNSKFKEFSKIIDKLPNYEYD